MKPFLSLRPLERAIEQATDGCAQVLAHAAAPWASVTFAGSRHVVRVLFEGARGVAAGEALIAGIEALEVPGRIVGEATVREAIGRAGPARSVGEVVVREAVRIEGPEQLELVLGVLLLEEA